VFIAVSIWPGVAFLNHKWPLFYGIFYRICFPIGPPVVATLLIVNAVKKGKGTMATLIVPVFVCFVVCVIFLIGDMAAYEAAYGPS
jgi:peptidoglycan/LPS O-acetylase OafA/YrhL